MSILARTAVRLAWAGGLGSTEAGVGGFLVSICRCSKILNLQSGSEEAIPALRQVRFMSPESAELLGPAPPERLGRLRNASGVYTCVRPGTAVRAAFWAVRS
jgi:hypothetical protein